MKGGGQSRRRHRRADLPIAVILAAVISAACLVSTVVVYFAVSHVAQVNTRELIRDKAEITIRAVEQHIRSYLDPISAQISHVATIIDRKGLTIVQPEAMHDVFTAALAATPQVSTIAFSDPEGHLIRAFRSRADERVDIRDWSDDTRFASTLGHVSRASEAYWGDLFIAEAVQRPFINFLAPVRRDGRFVGALIASVSVTELSRYLGDLESFRSGTPFILYEQDWVLAHPRLPEHLSSLSDEHPLPALTGTGDDTLALIWSEPNLDALTGTFSNGVSVRAVAGRSDPEVFLYNLIEGYGPSPWVVGAHMALSEIAPQLSRLDTAFYFLLVALALAIAAAMVLAFGLTRPIRRIEVIAEKLENLDLDNIPDTGPSVFRELNRTSEALATAVVGLRTFARHVPRALVRRLLHETAGKSVESEEREVTVLFTDIVGFTAIAENMTAQQVAAFLNRHLTLINGCIERHDGTTDKYIGDSLMAFWGAPESQPDHALRACLTAIEITAILRADNARRARKGLRPVRLRIGIHTGRAIVGEIGSPNRVNYTIVGDTVNVAERLEELARDFADADDQVCALLGDETARQVAGSVRVRSLGTRKLHGKHDEMEVFLLHTDAPGGN